MNTTVLIPSKRMDGRQRLMKAAESLFSRWGYARVSISQILEASDLRAPSLYHHYGGKEKLYLAWALQSLARVGSCLSSLRGSERGASPAALVISCLGTDEEINLLHLATEMDLFEDPETAQLLSESLEVHVVRPIQDLLADEGMDSSRQAALLLAQMAMLLRPGHRRFDEGLTAEALARAASFGLSHPASQPVRG